MHNTLPPGSAAGREAEMAVGEESSLSRWVAHNLAGILASIATFSVASVLLFALGAPFILILLALVLAVLIGLLAQRQSHDNW